MSKEQMTIRLYPETRRQMDGWLEESNSKNRNEFVEKALRFYMGYLGTENITEFLSDALVATLRGIIADSTNRTNGILFKCAVEQASWRTPSPPTSGIRWRIAAPCAGMWWTR